MTSVQLRALWDRLRSSYWFVPILAALASILAARLMVFVDELVPNALLDWHVSLFLEGPAQTRERLRGYATALLGTGGVVFSLLTIPMSMAASQFGSRLLRVYLRDGVIQSVLGLYVGSFIYCVALNFFMHPLTDQADAPQLAALVALLLSILTFGSLVVLAHYIGVILQAPNVAAAAARELRQHIDDYAKESDELTGSRQAAARDQLMAFQEWVHKEVRSRRTGYVRKVDPYRILAFVRSRDFTINITARPGDFVSQGELLAELWHPRDVEETAVRELRRCFDMGSGRTPTQDLRYAARQLVELAVRAMSPGINDPFTAMTCLDHLGDCLGRYAGRVESHPYYYDSAKRLRVIIEPVSFDELLKTVFPILRRTSRDSAQVLEHMAVVMGRIAARTKLRERLGQLRAQMDELRAEVEASGLIACDKARVLAACQAVIDAHCLEPLPPKHTGREIAG